MKKYLLITILSGVLFSSCVTTTFTTSELEGNYLSKMTSKKELAMKEKVKIFMSEKEVPNEFEVISLNRYTPLHIPILSPESKKVRKNLLEKAVKNASKQNGNGVLIVDGNYYKVIKY